MAEKCLFAQSAYLRYNLSKLKPVKKLNKPYEDISH